MPTASRAPMLTHDVQYDGQTVWVHSSDGFTVARFGKQGVDIHLPDATGCIDCTHGPTGAQEWTRFVDGCLQHYGVEIPYAAAPSHVRCGQCNAPPGYHMPGCLNEGILIEACRRYY